jgi:hypothetical protein
MARHGRGLQGLEETIMGRSVLPMVLARIVLTLSAAAAGGAVTSAQAASWLEKNFWMSGPRYDHYVPLCSDHGPLDKIMSRFANKESDFWNSSLRIVRFDEIREIAWEPWSSGTIPRRFCTASVLVSDGKSDGKRHLINYSIIEDAGMIGSEYGVEWCVAGLDRDWAYNPACRAARP